MGDTLISVEVACATPDHQVVVALEVPVGTVASVAVRQSDIQAVFPDIDIAGSALGIWGQLLGNRGLPAADEYILQPLDRVEIYRPLLADPKEVRRQRAAKALQRRSPGYTATAAKSG